MATFLFNKVKKLKQNTGFTLVEALVAIIILTLALGGPMTLATRSIKDSLAAKNKVIAFYLAQEVIEYVRNVRDSNFLQRTMEDPKTTSWLNGLDDCFSSSDGCRIDVFDTITPVQSCSGGCPKLKFDGTNYNYIAGTDSIFTRTINIDDTLNSGDEAEITVTVEWTDYGDRTVTLTQNMFNLAP